MVTLTVQITEGPEDHYTVNLTGEGIGSKREAELCEELFHVNEKWIAENVEGLATLKEHTPLQMTELPKGYPYAPPATPLN